LNSGVPALPARPKRSLILRFRVTPQVMDRIDRLVGEADLTKSQAARRALLAGLKTLAA
jgi:hypothetical protein